MEEEHHRAEAINQPQQAEAHLHVHHTQHLHHQHPHDKAIHQAIREEEADQVQEHR